jgi:hypothetical protein
MKIVNEKMNHDIAFMTLSPGDVFFFPLEGWYGMRLNDDNDHQDDNAVDLQTGELARLGNGDRVVLLKDAYLAI